MPTPEPIPPVLSVRALRKQYRDTVAVDDISFEVGRGEIVGLLGPNGAGKTTTINMVLGVLEPTSGRIVIEGLDRSEEHTSELQSLMRISYAVFCLQKTK